ncbi:MAG TPA: class I SAM-dependent methyltransferase [Ignavibacteria bacterium]|nr:class I SAM-dependent methyltransferase [Ignavibacteria bacterium]
MDEFLETNKKYWNESVEIHKKSTLYNVEAFKKGKNKLNSIELSEIGDISGKSLLHLQCHFGMDTLALARLGANATGIDFSEVAIKEAKNLSKELNISAKFIHTDINSLIDNLDNSQYKSGELLKLREEKFDIVFTSSGVLGWLPDINKWAEVINHYLKPGGFFYIAEIHPASQLYEYSKETNQLILKYPYFYSDNPLEFNDCGDYADRNAKLNNSRTFEWVHNISEVIMALLNQGLNLEFFHEFPFTCYQQYPNMKEDEEGHFRFTDKNISLPLMFSLKARKPA